MFRILRNCVAALVVAGITVGFGAQPAQAIAYGENARDGAYPFSVLLTMTGLPTPDHGTRDSSCSGALIAPRWVVTAGHCFRDASGRRVSEPVARRTTATIGRVKVNGRGGHVTDVVGVHQSETADVALAELDEAVTGVAFLRVGTTPPSPGESVRLTGFGLTAGSVPATRLQTGRFTVDRVGDSLLEISGRAPKDDTSPCPHDSGGPYFREDRSGPPVLVAVVSAGPSCPHTGADLGARTDNVSDWITATTTGSSSRAPVAFIVAGMVAALLAVVAVLLWRRTAR
ncbi:S1 family peptidase [Actinoplanes solisilvae]|uniref:S1 family peptidase n=1 Tax=Actinoplanes solisilvae TaxID=2486853 RepID=UPI001F0C1C9D|nr:S1 family peptidase [Actinoplanes solisilvae]